MYDNEFFVVDMNNCATTGEIINNLSLALESLNHSGKKIVLKLNDNCLNQSQMLSIQSLITSYGCILDTIETINPQTVAIAQNMNIMTQKPMEQRIEPIEESNNPKDFQQFDMKIERPIEEIAREEAMKLEQKALEEKQNEIQQQQIQETPQEFEQTLAEEPSEEIKEEYKEEYREENIEENKPENKEENREEVQDTSKGFCEIFVEDEKIEIPPREEGLEDTEKNSIGVYKKAYDESDPSADQWEEVDFYETPTNDPVVSDSKNTTYVNQTLRSGQVLESDGNVVIIGDCHPGSEIRATGDITVWGVLSGIAHAGIKGNLNAKVRALKLNAVQLRIGNCYSRRPDSNNIPYIIRSSIFTPEEARVVDGEIMLFKINQD